jgi:hypothetical protein
MPIIGLVAADLLKIYISEPLSSFQAVVVPDVVGVKVTNKLFTFATGVFVTVEQSHDI